MTDPRYLDYTEEAFVLANLKEFVKIWGSGNQALFQLECRNGQALLKLSCPLGSPADRHFVPPHVQHHGIHDQPHHRQFPRKKGQKQRERDRARTAAHRARTESKSDSTVPVDSRDTLDAPASEVTPSPPPAPTSAVSVERLPAAVPAFVGPAQEVCDEVCPDTVYASANDDDFGNDGSTAFRCFQCRMLYIPEAHREGNIIKNYELCQRHIGVLKCDGCAKMIVGMAKIRCHRQVCPLSA